MKTEWAIKWQLETGELLKLGTGERETHIQAGGFEERFNLEKFMRMHYKDFISKACTKY